MKSFKLPLPAVVSGAGFLAFILRSGLYRFGTDGKGLLVPGHPLEIVLWLLTAAVAVLVLLSLRKQADNRPYASNFPGSTTAAFGCLVFAAGLFVTLMENRYAYTVIETIRNAALFLAVPSLAVVAVYRKLGKRPFFGFHAILCLALTVHTVSQYSGWSGRPQLQDAFLPMMGCIGVMLFAYYQAAFDVDMGSRQMQLGSGLLAAFCCFAAIPESNTAALYLTGGIWTLTNLCTLTPAAEHKEDNP